MRLTRASSDNSLEYKGRELKLDLNFDVVLRGLELADDEYFSSMEKFYIWGEMFITNYRSLEDFNENDLIKIVDLIFDKLSKSENESDEGEDDEDDDGEKSFCFVQDAEYIYSSFKAVYDINLHDYQNNLPWSTFVGLLKGLPDDCKFKEIIGIRKQEVPARTKHNKDEVKRIKKLKRIYALKGDTNAIKRKQEMLNNKLSAIGDTYVNKGR